MARIITPFKRRKALVASFPRSGTHFLMNTLEKNFWHQAVPYVDLGGIEDQYYGTNIAHFFEVLNKDCPDPVIVKTHFEVDYFAQIAVRQDTREATTVLNIIREWFDIFYIWREMEPTMKSYAIHLKATAFQKNPRANPVPEDGQALADMEPWGSCLQHQMFQYPTFRDKWESHVEGWTKAAHQIPIIVVKYEDLNENFDDEVRRIGKILDYNVIKPERPPKDKNVVIGHGFVGA